MSSAKRPSVTATWFAWAQFQINETITARQEVLQSGECQLCEAHP